MSRGSNIFFPHCKTINMIKKEKDNMHSNSKHVFSKMKQTLGLILYYKMYIYKKNP